MTVILIAVIGAMLFVASISSRANQVQDVIQIDLGDITFESPPGWTYGVSSQEHKEMVGRVSILPSDQKGFIYHDQLMVSKLQQPPEIKPDWEIKTADHWRYVDVLHPSEKQSRDNPSIFIRFINHGDLWYAVTYVASLTQAPMDKTIPRYGIHPDVWDSINSIRFVQKMKVPQKPEITLSDEVSQ